jgi:hypothetical protein
LLESFGFAMNRGREARRSTRGGSTSSYEV